LTNAFVGVKLFLRAWETGVFDKGYRMNINATMEYKKAIDYIFQKIKAGELKVGSKIPSERDLAELLGIGRNSTREAISILRGAGLVESRHGSGNYISAESGATIKAVVSAMLALGSISKSDVASFRRAISKSLCDLLLDNGFTSEEKEHLTDLVVRMKTAPKEEFIKLDKEFHLSLLRATKNPLFVTVMVPISEVYLELVADVVEATDKDGRQELAILHEGILTSIDNKDRENCAKFVKLHYDFVDSSFL